MGARSLTRAADWRRVQKTGNRGRCDHLGLKASPREKREQPSRLGLRIRSRGPARAVARNRCRRRLKAAWREVAPPTGWDAVVSADTSLNGKTFQEVRDCLRTAL